jgi:hypothetical protein
MVITQIISVPNGTRSTPSAYSYNIKHKNGHKSKPKASIPKGPLKIGAKCDQGAFEVRVRCV